MQIGEHFSFKWERPSTIPFPHVWHRFQAKSSTGKSFSFRVEDLTPDRQDEAWKFFVDHYLVDEPIAKTLGVPEDEAAVASVEYSGRELMKQNVSLIAVLDEPGPNPKLIAVHIKAVISKGEELPQPPKKINSLVDRYNLITMYFREGIDVCQELDCDIYYDDFGLCVHKDYRRLGVADNMFEASRLYAMEFKIRGKVLTIVNEDLRRLPEKYGFRLYKEIAIKDMRDKDGNAVSPDDTNSIHFGLCQFY
ncbi:hypothetical protein V9T40_002511 [Parthenolecanium corni]|uniref:N-acetyltransferase domain-containing protein n=1 Tax=Parthenolecanium corni TaxID=536013 RepID=A0AAN9Y5N9_9HEMI